jgi:uncharacterized SAM-binding protein YcdF (DUF218 family)
MKYLKKVTRWFLLFFGIFAIATMALALTDIPYFAYHQLGTHCNALKGNPEVIVVLGGSGMPSADGLIRTYYASEAAINFPQADVIIAHPYDNDSLSTHQLDLMAHELIIRGVDSLRIHYEPIGTNTQSQASHISEILEARNESPVLVITSPEHMYRSIRSLQKAGLKNVGGLPSFEKPISEQKLKGGKKNGQKGSLAWRYNFWSYLRYEILVLREYCAIIYYKLKGWI